MTLLPLHPPTHTHTHTRRNAHRHYSPPGIPRHTCSRQIIKAIKQTFAVKPREQERNSEASSLLCQILDQLDIPRGNYMRPSLASVLEILLVYFPLSSSRRFASPVFIPRLSVSLHPEVALSIAWSGFISVLLSGITWIGLNWTGICIVFVYQHQRLWSVCFPSFSCWCSSYSVLKARQTTHSDVKFTRVHIIITCYLEASHFPKDYYLHYRWKLKIQYVWKGLPFRPM